MADLYCDHGLYGSVSFVANTTSGNSSITVTSVAAGGRIGLGTVVTGTGIPVGTYIGALGTGRGGTGTYTLHSNGSTVNASATNTGISMTGTYSNIALDPEWNVAQEGDGTGKTAATPATVSIDMTSWTFSISSTVNIMGCASAITCTAAATSSAAAAAPNAQYNATLTTMIDNLVTAINFQSASTVNVPAGWVAQQVRNAVWARRSGNSLQLMTRSGSASWNGLVAATFTNVTGSSSQSWGSGAGGAWGSLMNNNSATQPSAAGAGTVGLWCATRPLAGTLAAGDVVHCRSNKTVPLLNMGQTLTPSAMGASTNPVTFLFDDSTEWADGPNPVFTFLAPLLTTNVQTLSSAATSYAVVRAPFDRSTGYYGLVFDTSANSLTGRVVLQFGLVSWVGFKILSGTGATGTSLEPASVGLRCLLSDFEIVLNANRNALAHSNSGAAGVVYIKNMTVTQGSYASAHVGIFGVSTTNSGTEFTVEGLKCSGFTIGSALFSSHGADRKWTIRNPVLGNVTAYGAKVCQLASPSVDWSRESVVIEDINNGNGFVFDQRTGFAEFSATRGFPALNAQRIDGKKLSVRAFPSTVANFIFRDRPFKLPPFKKINSLTAGARTFRVEFCVKNSPTGGVAFNAATVWVEITYVDVNGDVVTVSTYSAAAGALSASASGWVNSETGASQESAGQPTWDDGGTIYFDKRYLEIATPSGKNLQTNTVVSATFCLAYTAGAITDMVFVDPDIGIA